MKYQDPRFRLHAENKGIFLGKYVQNLDRGPTSASEQLCQKLLDNNPPVPTCPDCPFSDEFFEETCKIIEDRKEAKVIQDIARLIVPSPSGTGEDGYEQITTPYRECKRKMEQFHSSPIPSLANGRLQIHTVSRAALISLTSRQTHHYHGDPSEQNEGIRNSEIRS